jgi:hypothetical protein
MSKNKLVSKIAYHQSCSSSLPEYIWNPMKGVWNSSHSKCCRSTSCYLIKHNIVMAPKASLTYLPSTQAWRLWASAFVLKHYYNGIFHISFFKAPINKWGRNDPGRTGIGEKRLMGRNDPDSGELTPTAFRLVLTAGKLNLPLVPSQYYVL